MVRHPRTRLPPFETAATLPLRVRTDFQMPGPNGLELIEAARKANGSLPTILMTAYLYVDE